MQNDKYLTVLHHIYKNPQSIQSNYARHHAQSVAMLASSGMITTFDGLIFGKVWLITKDGILEIYKQADRAIKEAANVSN